MKRSIKYLLASLVVITLTLFLGFKKNINIQNFHTYDTPHFTVYYEELNDQTLIDIEQQMEENYPEIQNFFGFNNNNKNKVIVYKSVERFQRAYLGFILSFTFGDWAAGAAYQDMVLLASPENPGTQHSYQDILDIALHEYVHTAIYQINQNADIWLDEGLATYLAKQQSATPDHSNPPTFEHMQSQSQGEFIENEGYTWSYKYVEYLVTTYGAEEVIELIKTNNYEECFRRSELAIYEEWVDHLGRE